MEFDWSESHGWPDFRHLLPHLYVLCSLYEAIQRSLTIPTGSDSAAHMSEEVKNAGIVVPRSMMWSYMINGTLGFITLTTLLFSIPDVEAAIDDPTGYPFLWVFQQSMPTRGTNALTIIVLVLVIASNISFNASTSRQTYAFARDKGLPFSDWIAHVRSSLIQTEPKSSEANSFSGAPKAQNPGKLGSTHLLDHGPPLSHQPRILRSFQRHHLPATRRAHVLLRHVDRLRAGKADPGPEIAPRCAVESRPYRSSNQYHCHLLRTVHLLLVLLADRGSGYSRDLQLGRPHLCGDAHLVLDHVFR